MGVIVGMRLADYLKTHKLTETAFAEQIGSTQQTVNRLCRGMNVPRPETLERIMVATDGDVRWEDFNPLSRGEPPSPAEPSPTDAAA